MNDMFYQPPQPPYPSATYPPPVFTDLSPLSRDLQEASAKVEHLQNQLDQREFREQAYSQVTESNNDRTLVPGRYGVPQELIDTVILSACQFIPQPPLRGDPLYLIELVRYGKIVLSKRDFKNDEALIDAFLKAKVKLRILRSSRTTATLLRAAISYHLKDVLLTYAGWQPSSKGYNYWVFPGFRSCKDPSQFDFPNILPDQTQAVSATAVNHFWPVFNIIRTPAPRQLIVLLYHEAALHTLLRQLGYKFPLAFCLFSTDETLLSYLSKLLSWFSDPPLTLDMTCDDLSTGLLFRRDQPLLVRDCGRLDHVPKSTALLLSALINGTVPWRNKRDTQSLPLQAPVVLLSSRPSALSCAPETIVIDLSSEDFDREAWIEFNDRVGSNQDYLTAFCAYTSAHIPDLQSALADGKRTALRLDEGQLTESCRNALGILIGIHIFLNGFFRFAELTPLPLPAPEQDEAPFAPLLELLAQTAQKADQTSLVDQFIAVARQHIQKGAFSIFCVDSCPEKARNSVLFDDDSIFFLSNAFFAVCQSLQQSRPVVLAALAEAGLFCGRQTNATTAQTRISVWNEHGVRSTISVYAFERSAFDDFGDPLMLEEMKGDGI